jgi:hypothetical protein
VAGGEAAARRASGCGGHDREEGAGRRRTAAEGTTHGRGGRGGHGTRPRQGAGVERPRRRADGVGRPRRPADGAAAGTKAARRRAQRRRGGGHKGGAAARAEKKGRERVREEKGERRTVGSYFPSLPSASDLALGKDFFKIIKYSLPSARSAALGKDFFAECPPLRHSAKIPYYLFAECLTASTRQSYLCRVSSLDTRQSIFLFFDFVSQTFGGMFLHYVDLHVSFVDNYNIVSIVSRFSSFI